MGGHPLRLAGLAATVVLSMAVAVTPSGAQEAPSLTPRASSVTKTDVVSADKAPSSRLAQTDPSLAARRDGGLVRVMIKLDYDSVATYAGGIDGLKATSPAVTGKKLTGKSAAEVAYKRYTDQRREAIVARVKAAAPDAQVGSSLDVVYGGVSAIVPASSVKAITGVDGVIAVQQNKLNQPLTDSSPDFIGAPTIYNQLGGAANSGKGVIYGNLDTGIWPEHPSFADLGNLATPPARSGGGTRECNYGDNPLTPATDVFACNKKLIGGDHQTVDYDRFVGDDPFEGTARDGEGHGTHTASTSAGNIVDHATVLGIDRGRIQGLAPAAWVMEYKVCGPQGCLSSDSARAVQQAILDGVSVINFSISGGTQPFTDPVELAFLDAYAAGVFVSASAGNEGPGASTANHLSPWVTTVGASTQKREWGTTLNLTADGGATFSANGISITPGIGSTPVVLAATAPGYNDPLCIATPPPGMFAGKIVACQRGPNRVLKGFTVMQGGAVGMILYNATPAEALSDSHWIPTVHLPDGTAFLAFLNSHTNVAASWAAGAKRNGQGDVMTEFSSRGPGGNFIKPDVTAPGAQILAGNTPVPPPPSESAGPPGEYFQAIAGTSMSSPHVAGSALLVRALHPNWTPGQVKSALMTTAKTTVTNVDGSASDPFDMGAGRIDLTKAGAAPLSFDETADNYFALGNDPVNSVHLNVPSINAPVMPGRLDTTRVAKNISGRRQSFSVTTSAPAGSKITVTPRNFTLSANQSITLNVTIEAPVPGDQQFGSVKITPAQGPAMHLPVAWIPKQAGVTLTQSCSPQAIQVGGTTACTVQAANNTFADTTADIFTETSGVLRVAGTDGGEWLDNRHAQLVGVHLAGRHPGVPSVDPGELFGYIPLSDFGVPATPIGDEQIINFNVPAFKYAGQMWSRIGVDSNGYVIVGGGSAEDNNCCNLPDGPDPARPNNMLAPFWTDLDGTGAPGVFVEVLTDGTNSWLVVEYQVNHFGTTDRQSFETWIGIDGTEDITYAYNPADLPSAPPPGGKFLVGAENQLGQGEMAATLPTADLRVTSTDGTPGDVASYVVFVRGVDVGTGTVTSSMTAEGNPGTTVVKTNVPVSRRTRAV